MFEDTKRSQPSDQVQLVEELVLSQRGSGEARGEETARASGDRRQLRASVVVEPGNASDRSTTSSAWQATARELSADGVHVVLPRPLAVGDVYRASFDRGSVDVAPALALCTRCRFLADDTYEAFLSFFVPIDLPAPPAEDGV